MQIKRGHYTEIDKGRPSTNTVDAVQKDDSPPKPDPLAPTHSSMLPKRHGGMYHCTEGPSGILNICALWSLDKTTSRMRKLKLKMAARNDFHWLRFFSEPSLTVSQFALRGSLSSFTKSIHSKGYGLQRSAISPPLSGSCFLSQSWLWLAPSALSELRYINTSGVREFKIVWNFPSLSH